MKFQYYNQHCGTVLMRLRIAPCINVEAGKVIVFLPTWDCKLKSFFSILVIHETYYYPLTALKYTLTQIRK